MHETGYWWMAPFVSSQSVSQRQECRPIHTRLLMREYFWDIGSYHMISPVEKPMMTSRCAMALGAVVIVVKLTSWQRG